MGITELLVSFFQLFAFLLKSEASLRVGNILQSFEVVVDFFDLVFDYFFVFWVAAFEFFFAGQAFDGVCGSEYLNLLKLKVADKFYDFVFD